MTLLDDLHHTAESLMSGWPIDRLNRARRAKEATMPDDRTDKILDRLTIAHGVVDSFEWGPSPGEDAADVLHAITSNRRDAGNLHDMLAGLAALLSDAGAEIARLNAECAGLRARCGK